MRLVTLEGYDNFLGRRKAAIKKPKVKKAAVRKAAKKLAKTAVKAAFGPSLTLTDKATAILISKQKTKKGRKNAVKAIKKKNPKQGKKAERFQKDLDQIEDKVEENIDERVEENPEILEQMDEVTQDEQSDMDQNEDVQDEEVMDDESLDGEEMLLGDAEYIMGFLGKAKKRKLKKKKRRARRPPPPPVEEDIEPIDDEQIEGLGKIKLKKALKKVKKVAKTVSKMKKVLVPVIAKATGMPPEMVDKAFNVADGLAKGKIDASMAMKLASSAGIDPKMAATIAKVGSAKNSSDRIKAAMQIGIKNPKLKAAALKMADGMNKSEKAINKKIQDKTGLNPEGEDKMIGVKLYNQGLLK